MTRDDADPANFAAIVQEIWQVRRALAAQAAGTAPIEPWLAEELLGKVWRDSELERVSGLDLLPLAETRSDDGEFRVEVSHFVDLRDGTMVCERVIQPIGLRGSRKPPQRHRLRVEDAGLYPGVSPRRIKLTRVLAVPTRADDISRVLDLADDEVPALYARLVARLGEPFAPPEVAVLFRPAALLVRSGGAGAVDGGRRFVAIRFPDGWRRDLPEVLPPAEDYAIFGMLSLCPDGPLLEAQSLVGRLAWDRGPVFPDRI